MHTAQEQRSLEKWIRDQPLAGKAGGNLEQIMTWKAQHELEHITVGKHLKPLMALSAPKNMLSVHVNPNVGKQ